MATVEIRELIKPETGEKFYPYAHLNGVKGAELLPRIGGSVQTTLPTPIFQVKDALNAQFYPQTHAEAVIGLAQMIEDNQFFEKESDGNGGFRIKLKDGFTGLYADGWVASGGVGSGGSGGGGLITSVKGVADLNTPIVSEVLTETFSSKAIQTIWDAVKVLQNTTPNVSLVNGANNSTLTVNGTTADFYTKLQIDAIVGAVYRPAGNAATVSELGTLTATNIGKVYNMTAAFTTTADFLEGAGKSFPAGTNVVIVDAGSGTYKYDVLSGFVDLSGYAQKVSGATAGNLVTLDSGGGILDSGYSSSEIGEVIIGTQGAATGSWTGVSKLATATDFKSGYRFTYWLPYAGSGNATLTLTFQDGTTKEINLYFKGTSRLTTHFGAGSKLDFVYLENASISGTAYTGAWVAGGYQDGNNYERLLSTYERRFIYSASAPLYRYKICGYNEGKLVPLTITNQASSSRIDKTPVSFGIDPKMGLVYYNTTTTVSSVSTVIGASTLYNEIPTTGCTYNFNDSVPIYRDVFLKGEIRADGLFYLDTTTHKSWYVFAPNRPSDGAYNSVFVEGCYYMYVGPTYSSANYLQFKYDNPVYQFLNGRLVPLDTKGDSVYSADEFYARISPNMQGSGTQTLSELRGRSIVWNQLVKNGNFADTTSWGVSSNTSGSASGNVLTVTASANVTIVCPNQAINTIKGHIYYVSYKYKINSAVTGDTIVREGYFGGTSTVWFTDANLLVRNTWVSVQLFVNTTSNNGRFYIGPYYSSGASPVLNSGETAEFKDVRLFDLTQMFGAGNEPKNVAQFEALFPDPYYPYNAGVLLSSAVTGVKTVGFNQWDEEWESGIWSSVGVKTNDTNNIRSKNYIPVIPGSYYCKSVHTVRICTYDAGKNFIAMAYNGIRNQIVSIGVGVAFVTICTRDGATTYANDICINLSDPAKNGTYEPHKESTLTLNIPSMTSGGTAIFPDGMKSVGSVYDYAKVDADGYIRKVVRQIGAATFNGTENWGYNASSFKLPNWYGSEPAKLTTGSAIGIGFCIFGSATETSGYPTSGQWKIIDLTNHGIAFNRELVPSLATATDASGWKTWLASNNLKVHYVLATPVEYTLDTPIYVGAKYYEGGMQYVLPEQGATPTSAPFRGVVKYGLTTGEIVDKMEGYLPLTGGTLTGPLTINSTLSVTGATTLGSTLSVADAITLSGSTASARRIYFGDSTHYVELDEHGFHFSHGVYSNDFVAAGGVGTGGGSGSATELGDLVDVSLSTRNNGDLLVYNSATSHWENKPQSSIIPTVSVSFADLTSHPTTLAGYGITDASISNGVITLGGSTIAPITTETDPTVPSWAKAQSKPSYSLSEISGTDDLRAIEELAGTAGLLRKTAENTWTLDTTQYLSSHQSVTLASGTNNGTLKLTTAAGTVDNIAVKGLQALAFKASLSASDIPDISSSYVPTTRTINGSPLSQDITITAQGLGVASWAMGSSSGSTIPFNVLPSLYVARTQVSDTAANGTLLGIDAISNGASSGNSDTSRFAWDSVNGAWHFLGNLYVDGWFAAGGIGEGSGGGYGVESITSNQDGTVDFHFTGGDVTTVDLNHEHPQYSSKAAEASNPSGGFLPDVVYELGTLTGSVTFALAAAVSGNVNHYFWTFTAGSTAPTITWPTGITWADGTGPTVAANKKYEISVLNGVAAFMEV